MPVAVLHAPVRLHPYTRHLIRWRGQHLATTARALARDELPWEYTLIPRYTLYDARTTENPKPSASPRLVPFRDKKPVAIPTARTEPFDITFHVLTLTPAFLAEAEDQMLAEDCLNAWQSFIRTPYPPTIYRAHRRDGIVPTDEVRFNGELRAAAWILGWIATRREDLGK
jgi:hypothetical protein